MLTQLKIVGAPGPALWKKTELAWKPIKEEKTTRQCEVLTRKPWGHCRVDI